MLAATAKVALAVFLASTYKTLPFAYLIRFYLIVFKNVVLKRRSYRKKRVNTFGIGTGKLDVFRAVTYNSYASPLEIDMYLHKSNSTYLVDLDLARTEALTQVLQKLFLSYYDNEYGEFKGKSIRNYPYIPIGTVKCVFKHEIKVFQRYSISSSIYAWDHKWLYVMLKFELKGKLCALAITKYVLKKKGRLTMKPREFLEQSGLYNDEVEAINAENYKLVSYLLTSEGLEEMAARM